MTRDVSRWVLAIVFAVVGTAHFVRPDFFLWVMPPWVPWPREVVCGTGVIEWLLAVALVVRRTARAAAWGVAAFLVAVTPVHVHMLQHAELYQERFGVAGLWGRLVMQGALVAWACRLGVRRAR